MRSLLRPAVLAVALVTTGGAAPPAQPDVSLLYSSHWGGLHTADMVVTARRAGGDYRMDLALQARGLTNLLFGLGFRAESAGRDNPLVEPRSYRYHARSRDEERRVELAFDPTTGLGRRLLDEERDLPGGAWTPREDEAPPLSAALRTGVVDPLSAFLALGRRTRAALAEGRTAFTVAVFDGRRRYDLAVRMIGRPAPDPPRLRVAMIPVAGFSKRHLRLWKGTVFEVTLDRTLWLPVRIAGNVAGPALVIRAVRTCPPAAGCALAERG